MRGWRRRAPGSRRPARRIHDDPGRLDHALAHERLECDCRGGHVAAWSCDETGTRELWSEQLRESVHEAAEHVGSSMLEPVPDRVERRVAKPEVGAEVDDEAGAVGQSRDEILRLARGKGDEDGVEPVEGGRVERREPQVAVGGSQVRIELRNRRAGRAVTLRDRNLENRVAGQQAQQLGSEVSGCPGDADLHSIIIRPSAYLCKRGVVGLCTFSAPCSKMRLPAPKLPTWYSTPGPQNVRGYPQANVSFPHPYPR